MTRTTHIFFDFFGTLVEYSASRTEQGYERSHQVLLSNGAALTYERFLEKWAATWRTFDLQAEANHDEFSMDDVVSGFFEKALALSADPDKVRHFRDVYLKEWNKGVQYIAEVPALLKQLSESHTLALVTNTHSADFVHQHLRNIGVSHFFSAVVTSVEHGKRKPHASIFEEALRITKGRSDQSIYVGDSFQADYIGSTGVGMRCLLIDPQKLHGVREEDRIESVLDVCRSPALDA